MINCMLWLIHQFRRVLYIFGAMLMKWECGHTLLIFIVCDLFVSLIFALLDVFLLKIIIRKFYILNYFVDRLPFVSLSHRFFLPAALLHFFGDDLVLQVPHVLVVGFDGPAHFLVENSGQFLVVLIVLTEDDNLIGKLVFFVLPFQELALFVEQYFILQKGRRRIVITLQHFLDRQRAHAPVVAVLSPGTHWEGHTRLHRQTKVNVINLIRTKNNIPFVTKNEGEAKAHGLDVYQLEKQNYLISLHDWSCFKNRSLPPKGLFQDSLEMLLLLKGVLQMGGNFCKHQHKLQYVPKVHPTLALSATKPHNNPNSLYLGKEMKKLQRQENFRLLGNELIGAIIRKMNKKIKAAPEFKKSRRGLEKVKIVRN